MAYPQLLVSFYQLFSYPVSTDCPIQILSYNLSTFYFLDPFLYKLPETLHCFIFRLFFSGDHTCLPLIYSIGKWNQPHPGFFHIVKHKIHRHRYSFICFHHLMTQAETTGLECYIRLKSHFFTFLHNHMVDCELAALYIQRPVLQVFYRNTFTFT